MYEAHNYRHISNPFERALKRNSDIAAFWSRRFRACGFRLSSIFNSGIHTIFLMAMVFTTVASLIFVVTSSGYEKIEIVAMCIAIFMLFSISAAHALTLHTVNGIKTFLDINKDLGYDGLPAPFKIHALDLYLGRKAIYDMDERELAASLNDGSFNGTIDKKARNMRLYATSIEKDQAIKELLEIAEGHYRFMSKFLTAVEIIAVCTVSLSLIGLMAR